VKAEHLITRYLGEKKGDLQSSLDAYMAEYKAKTEPNFIDRSSRIIHDMWLEVRQLAGESIHLSFMLTLEQGQGNAHRAMKFLTDLADKHKVPMSLIAKATGDLKGKMTSAGLKKFYGKYGFVEQRGAHMWRDPK